MTALAALVASSAAAYPLDPTSTEQARLETLGGRLPNARLLWVSAEKIWSSPLQPWNPQQVTDPSFVEDSPRWSPDGSQILFGRAPAGVWVMDADFNNAHQVIQLAHTASWTRDGRSITAISAVDERQVIRHDVASGSDEILYDSNDADYAGGYGDGDPLSQAAELRAGGRFLLTFTSARGTSLTHHTYVVDLQAKSYLYNSEMDRGDCSPAWAPDGSYLINTARLSDRPVVRARFDASAPSVAASTVLIGLDPAVCGGCTSYYIHGQRVANDGQWLAFGGLPRSGSFADNREIYVWKIGEPAASAVRVTFETAEDQSPDLFVGFVANDAGISGDAARSDAARADAARSDAARADAARSDAAGADASSADTTSAVDAAQRDRAQPDTALTRDAARSDVAAIDAGNDASRDATSSSEDRSLPDGQLDGAGAVVDAAEVRAAIGAGCTCSASPATTPGAAIIAVLLLAAGRRRRRILAPALGALCCLFFSSPPAFAVPGDGWIVWASDRNDGHHEIYLMQADGGGISRLTTTGTGAKNPMWSPDGRWIAYQTVPLGATRVLRWDRSEDHEVCSGPPAFWKHDNSGLVCKSSSDENTLDLYQVDPDTGSSSLFVRKSDFAQLAGRTWFPSGLTRDNRWLLVGSDRFRTGYSADNGTFTAYHAATVLDLQDRSKLYYFGLGCEPTAPPSGGWIFHVCGDGGPCATFPDLYKMQIADIDSRSSYQPEMAHADADWGHEYFPRISTDGLWLTYGATTGCHDHDSCDYEIFVHQLGQGSADRVRVTTDSGNDQWPHLYVGPLWGTTPPALATVTVTATRNTLQPGGNSDVTAALADQFGDPFAAVVAWSVSGGGAVAPASSASAVTQHTATFTSSGSAGTFTVTASAGNVTGSTDLVVADHPAHWQINCGSNDHDVAGWERDDAYVTGGADWVNPNDVDTVGVVNAAPAQIYKSVRHQGPHSYLFPVPDGRYTLRIHFADAYTDRSMDYFVEGQQILDNFDIVTAAGGVNLALVKEFAVTVSDGDGMSIEALDNGDDVFEAGIEIIPAGAIDGGVADSAGGGDGAGTSDSGPAADVAGSGGTDASGRIVTGSGCGCGVLRGARPALIFVLLASILAAVALRRARQRR